MSGAPVGDGSEQSAAAQTPELIAMAAPASSDFEGPSGLEVDSSNPGNHDDAHAVLVSSERRLSVERSQVNARDAIAEDQHEAFIRRDPLGFLKFSWDKCNKEITDYRCTFTKLERVKGELRPEQITDVRFLREPFSVDMTFTKNVAECKRALYVVDKWVDDEGNQQAWAKPGGAIVRLLISKILQPIHGSRAQNASRRTIDQFGFGKTFELFIYYSEKAKANGELTLRYVGHGEIGGRPTYKIERILPYDGDEANYPDNLLILHMDQETLLPVGCFAYSDEAGKELLGSYIYTDVVLNPGYEPKDFDPDLINF
ncbi:MAG: DUF1571 domain-containing protein [Planctomycetes bacterium]|nr:DUF1571 domain-containing protein [Planctomycetota bacterium]